MTRAARWQPFAVLAACVALAASPLVPSADDPPVTLVVPSLDDRPLVARVDLTAAAWEHDGAPAAAVVEEAAGLDVVALPLSRQSSRWSTTFDTPEAGPVRLGLTWLGGPDGLLFEVMLDGQTVRPVRDAWRPGPRTLRHDLGPFWLGRGEHLLEFIAREDAADGVLRVATLELRGP